jgi:hypothetical protein
MGSKEAQRFIYFPMLNSLTTEENLIGIRGLDIQLVVL